MNANTEQLDNLLETARKATRENEPARVIEACEKALDIAPGDGRFEFMQGAALRRAGDYEKALSQYQKADQSLKKIEGLLDASPAALRDNVHKIAARISVRINAFESPQGSVEAAIILCGSGEDDDVAKVFWDLRKKPESEDGAQRRRGRGALVNPGSFKVSLMIDGKEVMSKKLEVIQDPILN